MKKLFLLAVVSAFVMASCSKNEEKDVSLLKKSYTLYHSQTESVQGENVIDLDWYSENEFVATVSDGVIEGQFVGETNVNDPAYGLSFSVEVKPKYNLYDEPNMDWGASITTIKNRYGTPYYSDSEMLLYKSSNNSVPYYMYYFENGRLKYSYALVKLSASSALVDFLTERYLAVDVDMSTYTATFTHFYGKISDPQFDYAVGFTYSSSIGGILVCYAPESSTYTRTDKEIQQRIENLLIEKGIRMK